MQTSWFGLGGRDGNGVAALESSIILESSITLFGGLLALHRGEEEGMLSLVYDRQTEYGESQTGYNGWRVTRSSPIRPC